METNQITLESRISEIRSFLDGKELVNLFVNQFTSIEEYAKIEAKKNLYSELDKELRKTLPINRWVKVNLNGEEFGVINFESSTPFGFWAGLGLEKWQEKMPDGRLYSARLANKSFLKAHKVKIVLFILVVFLLILSIAF